MGSEHDAPGSRKGPRQSPTFQPKVLLLALATTVAIVAWGYLVYLAIDFGTSARGWREPGLVVPRDCPRSAPCSACSSGWCSWRDCCVPLGITEAPVPASEPEEPVVPRPPGGRRAAR